MRENQQGDLKQKRTFRDGESVVISDKYGDTSFGWFISGEMCKVKIDNPNYDKNSADPQLSQKFIEVDGYRVKKSSDSAMEVGVPLMI